MDILKDLWLFYERAQKILACSYNYYFAHIGNFNCIWRRKCTGTVYLYIVLIFKTGYMEKDTSRKTILVITVGFIGIFLLFNFHWALYVSLIIGLIGIISEKFSKILEYLWMKLAKLLSLIIPNIILAVVYYFILFPISLLSKLFTKDPLMLSGRYSTYFVDIKKDLTQDSFEKMW